MKNTTADFGSQLANIFASIQEKIPFLFQVSTFNFMEVLQWRPPWPLGAQKSKRDPRILGQNQVGRNKHTTIL